MSRAESKKWQDNFYVELHPYPKLVLNYIYDNCQAGFIEYIPNLWLTQIQGIIKDKKYPIFTKNDLINSLSDLKIKLLSDGKKKLFIKDYLKHQKKLPLISGIEENDWIIDKLTSNLEGFGNPKEISDILKNVRDIKEIEKENKKKVKEKKRFVVPLREEFKEYYLSEKPDAIADSIDGLYDHYVSCGWKVGSKPMVDWEAAIRGAIKREKNYRVKNNYSNGTEHKKSRTETAFNVAEELKNNR